MTILKGFDPYAMAIPKTKDDIIALLSEALDELRSITELFDIPEET